MTEITLKQPDPLETSDSIVALSHSLTIMSANHVISRLVGHAPKPGKPFNLNVIFSEPELRVRK